MPPFIIKDHSLLRLMFLTQLAHVMSQYKTNIKQVSKIHCQLKHTKLWTV